MNDDIVEELNQEILYAQNEGRLSDSEFFEACLSEILRLRELIEGNRVFGPGYLRGEQERIALACMNDELRHENAALKEVAPPVMNAEVLAKIDRLTKMTEGIHRLLVRQEGELR